MKRRRWRRRRPGSQVSMQSQAKIAPAADAVSVCSKRAVNRRRPSEASKRLTDETSERQTDGGSTFDSDPNNEKASEPADCFVLSFVRWSQFGRIDKRAEMNLGFVSRFFLCFLERRPSNARLMLAIFGLRSESRRSRCRHSQFQVSSLYTTSR